MNGTQLARWARALVTSTVAVGLVFAGSPVAEAVPTSGGPGADGASGTESVLRIQAQELAGQIQAQGQDIERLAESFNAAQLRSQQLASSLRILNAAMARTDAQVKAARAALKKQALLSYMTGGAPRITNMPDRPGSDRVLTVSYAQIVSHGQQRAVDTYRAVLASQTRESAQLTAATREAAAALVQLEADRTAATKAEAARQQTLAGVQGQLATLVAQVQAAQQKAQQASVQARLARQGQLPPAAAALTAAPSRSPAPPAPRQPAPATTAAPPPPTRVAPTPTTRFPPPPPPPPPPPSTTSPPPTSPPTTSPPPPPSHNVPARGSSTAVRYAYAQLGKPYQWAGAGPGSFDCSGLTMMAWQAAGVYLPHLAQAQYDLTTRIPLGNTLAGDLIFFGTPNNVYHVGIYIGGGQMIDAPAAGLTVSISSIYWVDLLGAGRIVN